MSEPKGSQPVYLTFRELNLILTLCEYRSDTRDLRKELERVKARWVNAYVQSGS